MNASQRTLALAAIDPNQALAVPDDVELEPSAPDEDFARPRRPKRPLTLAVTVDPPPKLKRWRFFVFWCLVKLAAWVYPFEFEIYRTEKPWERE